MKSDERASEGQSMVEFALVLPLWLLIIGMVFMVAWLGYLQFSLERAVHEGAYGRPVFRETG